MSPDHLAVAVSFLAVLLFALRLGHIWQYAGRWDRLSRISILALLVGIFAAFIDVANDPAPFLWRQWVVLICLVGVVGGQVGLLWGQRADDYDPS